MSETREGTLESSHSIVPSITFATKMASSKEKIAMVNKGGIE